jgi:hypothetical protein
MTIAESKNLVVITAFRTNDYSELSRLVASWFNLQRNNCAFMPLNKLYNFIR